MIEAAVHAGRVASRGVPMPDRDDKDRLGDTLHRKERGDEERYFAELDRQRLARLRDRATSDAGTGSCPRCGRPLAAAGEPRSAETCDGGCPENPSK